MRLMSVVRFLMVMSFLAAIGSALAAVIAKGRLTSRGGPEDDEVDLVTIFEPQEFTSSARALRRITATTMYGGGTIDLLGAMLDPGGATVRARTIFGGFRLVIPAAWRVELDGIGFAGGSADGRDQSLVDPQGPVLRVRSTAVFGGIGIVSEGPDRRAAEPVKA